MFSIFVFGTTSVYFYSLVKNRVKDRALGLILGCSVGDAKGIPFENQTKEQIMKKLQIIDQNLSYIVCGDENPYIPKGYGPGMWTDDTQLSLAMMRSLIRENKMDMDTVVEEHTKEYQRRLMGWGGTRECIKRLLEKTHTYKNSGNPATGNGVLMKLSPLAFFYANRSYEYEKIKSEVETLCVMTHKTPTAIITAICFTIFSKKLFEDPSILKCKNKLKDLLKEMIQITESLDKEYILEDSSEIAFQKATPKLKELLENFEYLNNDEILIKISNGGTFYCLNSMIMVMGILLSNTQSFDDILRVVYIGGDTDSNASMVGAILSGCLGSNIIPKNYITDLQEKDEIIETGRKFSELFK